MTYREAIKKQIQKAEYLYDSAGTLRDYANSREKQAWNQQRTLTRQLVTVLQALDNMIGDRWDMEVSDQLDF